MKGIRSGERILVDLHLEDLEEDGMLILISTVSSENRF
jgi:hypothetical protein